jgi:hypoxanthine phosphoribosyltransferase
VTVHEGLSPRGSLRVLLDADTIDARIRELGAEIDADLVGLDVTFLCVLKGAMPFFGRLATSVGIDARWDVIGASSYLGRTQTSGTVRVTAQPDDALVRGAHVVLVEDIVDTRLTLTALRIATLLDKPSRRRVVLQPDWVGFTIPDEFVVGFGLDLDERMRGLPYVAVFSPESE